MAYIIPMFIYDLVRSCIKLHGIWRPTLVPYICVQLLETSWLASIFRSLPSCPGTNNSNQTWRFPTFHLGSSSLAHFASLMQSCFGSAGQTRAGSPLFYDFGISFSCKASLLQHNPHKDLVCQFGCHTWKPEVSFLSWNLYLNFGSELEIEMHVMYLPEVCLCQILQWVAELACFHQWRILSCVPDPICISD